MAYFTKEELEAYIESTVSNAQYQEAEAIARQRIEAYCNQAFEPASVTERIDVRYFDFDVTTVPLKRKPVQNVVSVVDDQGLTLTEYIVKPWGLQFKSPLRCNHITVTYDGGYPNVPEPIKRLALYIAKLCIVKLDKPTPSVASISSGGTSYTFILADINRGRLTGDDEMDAIANQYKRLWYV